VGNLLHLPVHLLLSADVTLLLAVNGPWRHIFYSRRLLLLWTWCYCLRTGNWITLTATLLLLVATLPFLVETLPFLAGTLPFLMVSLLFLTGDFVV
jgi:hypothetical protein